MIDFVLGSLLIVAILGLVFARGLDDAPDTQSSNAKTANAWFVAIATAATCGSFYGWTAVITAAARDQRPLPIWLATLPYSVIDDRAPFYAHAPYGTIVLIAVLAQTASMIALYLVLRGRRTDRFSNAIIAIGFASMSLIAFGTTVMTSFDTYAYAGAAHRGLGGGYALHVAPFDGEWSMLNRMYGAHAPPSPYGPVWQLAAFIATGWAPTVGTAIASLRVLEFIALCACVASVRVLDTRPEVRALFLLNPAIFAVFIVDGHNDLFAVALVLVAMVLSRRAWILALVLAACAGAVKLPFLAIASLAFAREPDLRTRLWRAAGVVILGIAISAAFGGLPYVRAMSVTGTLFHSNLAEPLTNTLRAALGLSSLIAIAYVLVRRRASSTAAWTFLSISAAFFGWYLAWGLPYALIERRWFATFLIVLPIANFTLSTTFAVTPYTIPTFFLTFLLAPTLAAFTLRRTARILQISNR